MKTVLETDFVLGGQDTHDFVAHSVVYTAIEVYYHIVTEFHIFLDAFAYGCYTATP